MRSSDKAIVLQAIKHGDKKLILKLYTQHHGMVTAGISVGKSPKSKIKASSILPMSLIEAEFIFKENKDIQQLTEARCYAIHTHLHRSISKLSIAQFMNEVLIKALKEHQGHPSLFEFIELSLKFLNDSEEDFANLHLYFLIELTKYLGFEPQNNFSERSPFFDCREGQFSHTALVFPLGLNKEESAFFSEFLKINALKIKLSYAQRQLLLDILLAYYRFHVNGFNSLKSMEVLKEVFSDQ